MRLGFKSIDFRTVADTSNHFQNPDYLGPIWTVGNVASCPNFSWPIEVRQTVLC
jgi:hypothetical protein